jgi:hypothetical protein
LLLFSAISKIYTYTYCRSMMWPDLDEQCIWYAVILHQLYTVYVNVSSG